MCVCTHICANWVSFICHAYNQMSFRPQMVLDLGVLLMRCGGRELKSKPGVLYVLGCPL